MNGLGDRVVERLEPGSQGLHVGLDLALELGGVGCQLLLDVLDSLQHVLLVFLSHGAGKVLQVLQPFCELSTNSLDNRGQLGLSLLKVGLYLGLEVLEGRLKLLAKSLKLILVIGHVVTEDGDETLAILIQVLLDGLAQLSTVWLHFGMKVIQFFQEVRTCALGSLNQLVSKGFQGGGAGIGILLQVVQALSQLPSWAEMKERRMEIGYVFQCKSSSNCLLKNLSNIHLVTSHQS